jgi:hypothetical protein
MVFCEILLCYSHGRTTANCVVNLLEEPGLRFGLEPGTRLYCCGNLLSN